MNLRVIGCYRAGWGWRMAGTDSGLCLMADLSISDVEATGSATTVLKDDGLLQSVQAYWMQQQVL